MSLPDSAYLDFTPDLHICRVLTGLWQVSGAHGTIDPNAAIPQMHDYADAGLSTWDVADHYGLAEDFIGAFGRQTAQRTPPLPFQAFTKWVPSPGPMTRQIVEQAVNTSLRRMRVDRLDLLQFHWWDYSDPRYLDALRHLAALCDDGRIRHLALTNFDTAHLDAIAQNGIRIVSNQVQYSLIDRRPEVRMADYCTANQVWLLAYGTISPSAAARHVFSQNIPAERIEPNPFQARKTFPDLDELADAIRTQGFTSRLRVRAQPQRDGYFQLVYGERRLRAAKLAGLREIPCDVADYSDAELIEIGLAENIQRRDLNPLEAAQSPADLYYQRAAPKAMMNITAKVA